MNDPRADPYADLLAALSDAGVRYLAIGVQGANYYTPAGGTTFATEDLDLFLPPEPENLLAAWRTCRGAGYRLLSGAEPLGEPLDLLLAERVVERRAAVRASHPESGAQIDLSLVMAGFEFADLWPRRRTFRVAGAEIAVAPLAAIVESKRRAGRKKDLLFLTTHDELLREALGEEDG